MQQNGRHDTAIVTGASRGIGVHIARALAAAGHPVALAARTGSALEETATAIRTAGGRAITVEADVTLAADRERVVETAERELGSVGVLVNNAAQGPMLAYHLHDADDVAAIVAVNLHAPMELTRLALPGMLERGRGNVVSIATMAAKLAMPYMALYSATKAGLSQFSAALALEYAGSGVSFTTVFPGAVSGDGMSARAAEETGVALPTGGAVAPGVVADAVLEAIRTGKPEILVAQGARLVTRHPQLGYFLMRKTGAFDAMKAAADRYRELRHEAA